ncbi:hypothetical protein Y032_0011g1568 [Ancylostoma ceylanicum]|nr:hypothetical protein Y032_0011g1568 [Ancylostoma ceylanicum]
MPYSADPPYMPYSADCSSTDDRKFKRWDSSLRGRASRKNTPLQNDFADISGSKKLGFWCDETKRHFYFTVILLTVYSVPTSAGLVNISPDQEEAKQWVLQEYSCAKSVIDAPRLHVYTPTSVRRLVITASVLAIFAIVFFLYILRLSFHSLNKGQHLSQKTKLLQRRFLIYLCVQVSVPLFIFIMPVLILMYMFGTSAPIGQGGGNFALCCMGFHGALSPMSLIMCNDSYRNFIFTKMRCRCVQDERKVNASCSAEQIAARSTIH